MASSDPVIDCERALALVFETQALTLRTLQGNPDKEEERKLNKRLARLKLEETDLIAVIDALEDGFVQGIQPPSDAQVKEIARLTGEVENARRANVTAAMVLVMTGHVLDLAVAVTGA